jgi:hypothetical protein
MDCPKCGYAMSEFDVDCPRCKRMAAEANQAQAAAPPPPPEPPKPSAADIAPRTFRGSPLASAAPQPTVTPPSSFTTLPRIGAAVAIGVLIFGVIFLGKYHIVQSEHGTRIIPKVHFSFSETVVSLETITTIPYIKAKSQHPLAVRALQREGIIETEEEMDARVQREVDEKMQEAEAEAQRRMEEAQREMNTRIEQERRRIESQFPSSYP